MTELKHTPATWIIEGIADRVRVFSGNIIIANVIRDYKGDSETIANAKLIAAAPDLLDALIACDDAMEYISEWHIPINLPNQVKDAIEKATA